MISGVVGDDEDNYGMEMGMYLNEDDILKPGQTNNTAHGILRYCTPINPDGGGVSKVGRANRGKRKSSEEEGKAAKRARRSDTLPDFSSDEGEKGSDDELPEFNTGAGTNIFCFLYEVLSWTVNGYKLYGLGRAKFVYT